MAQAQKRRPASNWAPIEAPPPQPPTFVARLIDAVTRRRAALRRLGVAASVVIIAVSLTIFVRTLLHVDPTKFKAAIAGTGGDQIMLAFAFTALSYLALTGYDGLALQASRDQGSLPADGAGVLHQLCVFVHARVSAGDRGRGPLLDLWARRALRRQGREVSPSWPGSPSGSAWDWWSAPASSSASEPIADIDHFHPLANRLIGLCVIGALIVYLAWIARMRWRDATVLGEFRFPGLMLTLGQMALGVIDICSASAALYVLLPRDDRLGFPTFATLYSFASMLGIASHAPGGLGVFEATILQGVGGSEDAVLASLLLFRGIYYVVPFIAAMALLGGVEAVRRWRSLREAMSPPSDDWRDGR